MSDVEVSSFLTKVLKEQDFNFNDPAETIYWYCYYKKLPYSKALDYIEYYETIPEDPAAEADQDFFREIRGTLKLYLTKEKHLKDYLAYIKSFHQAGIDSLYSEYEKLYRRAGETAARIMKEWRTDRADSECKVTPTDIESILCSGVARNDKGNLMNLSGSALASQFQKKRMSRQKISSILRRKTNVERFDIITLLFLVYAVDVEPDWPTERYLKFIDEVNEILEKCDMMSIYPVNPYESFILMCLLTEEPLTVYSDIWEMSYQ